VTIRLVGPVPPLPAAPLWHGKIRSPRMFQLLWCPTTAPDQISCGTRSKALRACPIQMFFKLVAMGLDD